VTEIAGAVAAGDLSALEVLDAHLERIESRNPELNAIVVPDFERARRRAADPRPGPLQGVPFTVKEAIEVAGLPGCEASRLRPLETATADAAAVARLRAAGAILVGKTNISELCAHPDSTNLVYGATRNPVDPSRSPCGSSGGEAAAVGAELSAFGLGSDYGGSIRAPAHFCGVAGMRPGLGRIPTAGHLPRLQPPGRAYWSTIGPFARSVADLALVMSVLVGEPLDGAPLPLRVGIYRDGLDRPLEASCAGAVAEAAARLEVEVEVVEVTPPFQVEAERLYETVSAWESRTIIEGLGDLDQASHHLRSVWELVREAPPTRFDLATVEELEARAAGWLDETPVLLCPAAASPAFAVGYGEPDVFDLFHHCKLASALGLPAAVVPVSTSAEGLPVGVQIVGRRGREDEVLAVAAAIEAGG
jgi:Asp-tRNA(Asn)/Glu-tRNA(Gln) amidotransferase A subunit family amidase